MKSKVNAKVPLDNVSKGLKTNQMSQNHMKHFFKYAFYRSGNRGWGILDNLTGLNHLSKQVIPSRLFLLQCGREAEEADGKA